ncbi:leucine--tRNA ligase [Candidatus Pacearchaeota archaeon CG_4_10_14_0_2_um_filter_31_10]|nr:MAG: leucine--tRNA ligase [Candidatus Pacearchaeota archaeon CG_4_10_14_0_2_um_filter_31_10]
MKRIDKNQIKKEKKIQSEDKIDFSVIEKKWQEKWEKSRCFTVKEDSKKKKCYVLEMYPYPSASFLHMGHVRNYTIGDVFARFKRMNGFNVLYPMGYDSFGLPAETAAKKEGIHPKIYTENSIKKIMEYQKALGNSYDWSKIISSHNPDYYRWNQYFFLKLFEKGLAYRKKAPVNWCENCQSVLANEEAEGGKCWRCGKEVIQKDMEQWFFKITEYADKLLEDLEKIDWPEKIKIMQKNWIGKSEGVDIYFHLEGSKKILSTFTTRCDTIFSVTFLAVAPESPLIDELVKGTKYEKEVKEFIKKVMKEKIEDRINEEKEKEGGFTGKYAINPTTKEKIPIYVSNFAVMYGTGVVMCDAHDKRDFRFARKYKIPLKFVISKDGKPINPKDFEDAFVDDGVLFNSGPFSSMNNREALPKMADWLEKNKMGKKTLNYKIKDWMISRQRYWGTPIPIIYCEKCGIVPVPEKELPVLLPEKVNFKSVGNPLASCKEFVETKCSKCKGKARRETDTMGGFVDSSWYFLRYCDNKNKEKPFEDKKVNYWMPVDQYIGGAEHAVMHLIYARFFIKALKDLGFVKFDEPFSKLFNQGIVYKDGHKMSKSFGNVIFQTDISNKYGIDTARLFLMFVASPDKQMEWNDEGVEGTFRIINKMIRLAEKVNNNSNPIQDHKINLAIKNVTASIENFEYPKAIISIVECVDAFADGISKENYKILLKLLHPFCPHITEELWEKLGGKNFISLESWPKADEKKINDKFEQEEKAVENLGGDINNVLKIMKEKSNKKSLKVYIYVLPNELSLYKNSSDLIKKKTGLDVEIFAVNDKNKYDPENKSGKTKPGKPAIYLN